MNNPPTESRVSTSLEKYTVMWFLCLRAEVIGVKMSERRQFLSTPKTQENEKCKDWIKQCFL